MSNPLILEQVRLARFHCEQADKFGYAAAWSEENRDYLMARFLEEFECAARELGFTLTPITEAPHVATPSTVDPNSGRPSLEEPAANPTIFQNYGE